MENCPKCGEETASLGQHFRWNHETSYKEYIARESGLTCLTCGKRLQPRSHEGPDEFRGRRFCGRRCFFENNQGENHPNYKGGTISEHGYRRICVSGEQVYEHRYFMELILGRPLKESELVHHINGDKTDNRPHNLTLTTRGEHCRMHKPHEARWGKTEA